MRKEAALIAVLRALGMVRGARGRGPNILAHWTLDEGIGQVAGDTSGLANTGSSARLGIPTAPIPVGLRPRRRRRAELRRRVLRDGARHRSARAPAHRGRRLGASAGSPGPFLYVLSNGSVECNHSAYGLYTGFTGGMAFYVSSPSQYTLSPEVPPRVVWDGRWHHVIGSYDGELVRLWIDGSQVGTGEPASVPIAYTNGSKGVYIGAYRGTCDLGFSGAIDDVAVWDDLPAAATTGPVIAAVADTPTQVAIARARRRRRPATPRASPILGCPRVSLSRRNIPVRRKTKLIATVRRDGLRVVGARIVVSGKGVTTTGARTNHKGTTKIAVRARRAGGSRSRSAGRSPAARR